MLEGIEEDNKRINLKRESFVGKLSGGWVRLTYGWPLNIGRI